MLAYASAGVEQTERWTPAVDRLRSALDALMTAMADVPDRFRLVPAVDMATVFEDLVAEQEHQDGFVRVVAEGLLRANGFEHVLTGDLPTGGEVAWPDGVLRADEGSGVFASVGSASLAQQMYDTGQDDAAELLALLEEAGVVEPGGDEHLTIEDPRWEQILGLLETAGSHMDDPYYATAFYDTLGAEGTLALAGGLDDIAVQDTAYGGAVDHSALADPLIAGFAQYTNTMDPADWDQLVHIEADENWQQERTPLAVLFSGPGELYQPELLAQAAESVIMTRINSGQAKADLPEALVMRSLAENPDAAWYFVVDNPDAEEITSSSMWLLTNPLGFGVGDYYTEAGGTEPDYLDDRTAAWLGTESHELIAELHELWATTVWLEGHGLAVELRDELGDPTGIGARDRLSLLAGSTPILGDLLFGYEVVVGNDPLTGEESTNRWRDALIAIGIFLTPFAVAGMVKHFRKLKQLDRIQAPPAPPSQSTRRTLPLTQTRSPDSEVFTWPTYPLERLAPEQLLEFRSGVRQNIRENWPWQPDRAAEVLASLPAGHPFKDYTPNQLAAIGYDFDTMAGQALRNGDTSTTSFAENSGAVYLRGDSGDSLVGLDDWQIYALLRPVIGDVNVSGVYLPRPDLDGALTLNPYDLGDGGVPWTPPSGN